METWGSISRIKDLTDKLSPVAAQFALDNNTCYQSCFDLNSIENQISAFLVPYSDVDVYYFGEGTSDEFVTETTLRVRMFSDIFDLDLALLLGFGGIRKFSVTRMMLQSIPKYIIDSIWVGKQIENFDYLDVEWDLFGQLCWISNSHYKDDMEKLLAYFKVSNPPEKIGLRSIFDDYTFVNFDIKHPEGEVPWKQSFF